MGLDGFDGTTDLSITERNIPSEQAKAVSEESWTMVLENLKKVLESSRRGHA